MAEEDSKAVDEVSKEAPTVTQTTADPSLEQPKTTAVKDEPKPTVTEGTDVAAPANASVIPNDTPAQTGPTMGEHCVTDKANSSGEKPAGEISKIADVEVYISKPSDYPQSPSKLLLLLSNAIGIHSTNNQIQADHFAQQGFLTVMPDQFGGDTFTNSGSNAAMQSVDESNTSVLDQIKLRAVDTVQAFRLDMWLARQTPEKILPVLQKFVTGAKEEFADAVAFGGGIYVIGYCIGAKYALLLSSDLPDTEAHGQGSEGEPGVVTKASEIKAVAIAHGTMIAASDFEKLRVPLTVVAVENDPLFPQEIQEAGLKHLQDKKITHTTETYRGVQHGFAVVGGFEDAHSKESQKEAFKQMVEWLKVH